MAEPTPVDRSESDPIPLLSIPDRGTIVVPLPVPATSLREFAGERLIGSGEDEKVRVSLAQAHAFVLNCHIAGATDVGATCGKHQANTQHV